MTLTELARLEEMATEGPWTWYIHDYSMATLCADGDPIENPIMDVGPCKSCANAAKNRHEEWKWGRCLTPKENNACLIVALRNHAKALIACAEELRNIADAKRFNRDHFRDDTEFADWVKSRAIHTLRSLEEV